MPYPQPIRRVPAQGGALLLAHPQKLLQRLAQALRRQRGSRNSTVRLFGIVFRAVGRQQQRLTVLHHSQQQRRIGAVGGLRQAVIPTVDQFLLYGYGDLPDLGSCPTRRSSNPPAAASYPKQQQLITAVAGDHGANPLPP